MTKLLELKNISKTFPGVKALQNVNLDLEAGEVLGLCGENGAGKSTLMKILTGIYTADPGGRSGLKVGRSRWAVWLMPVSWDCPSSIRS